MQDCSNVAILELGRYLCVRMAGEIWRQSVGLATDGERYFLLWVRGFRASTREER